MVLYFKGNADRWVRCLIYILMMTGATGNPKKKMQMIGRRIDLILITGEF